jgi:hypothetical protein
MWIPLQCIWSLNEYALREIPQQMLDTAGYLRPNAHTPSTQSFGNRFAEISREQYVARFSELAIDVQAQSEEGFKLSARICAIEAAMPRWQIQIMLYSFNWRMRCMSGPQNILWFQPGLATPFLEFLIPLGASDARRQSQHHRH